MDQKRITNQILNQTNYTLNSTLNYLFNISNMKKLFSYLLISSMVILSSCTNYDDQFDDLNTQINSLKSQIEGFSSLSSGLTSLQGTVAGLQAAVAALPTSATPATDISGLEAAVAALQTAISGAATAAEVAALTADLASTQAALEASIAAASTPATDISGLEATVAELKTSLAAASTSAEITAISAELAAAEVALTAAVAANATAVAGNTTDIAALATSLEALSTTIAALQTTLGTVSTAAEVTALATSLAAAQADLAVLLSQSSFYSTAVSITTVAELEFATSLGDKLNVVNADVTITQTADMDATALQAVMAKMLTVTGDVVYNSTSTPTTKSSFTNLKSAGSLDVNQTGGGNISLPNFTTSTGALVVTGGATTLTVSLPKLVSAGTFALTAAKATTFSAPVLAAHDHSLTINIADSGSIDLSKFTYSVTELGVAATSTAHVLTVNANTLTAPVFKIGKIVGVEIDNVSLPVWEGDADSVFADATTVVLPKVTAYGADLALDLEDMFPKASSIHIIGNSSTSTGSTPVTSEVSVSADAHTKLETIILDGTFGSVTLHDDTDLVTLTVDITAEDFTLDNSDVVTADIKMTATAASSTGKTSVTVKNNTKLSSITVNEANALNTLTITDNSDLISVSFPDLDKAGGTFPNALISGNDLKATMTKSVSSATPAVTSYVTTGTSGIQNLKAFLDSVILTRKGSTQMTVKIDELTVVSELGVAAAAVETTIVDLLDGTSSVGADARAYQLAVVIDPDGSDAVQVTIAGDNLFVNASGGAAPVTPSDNMALAVAELKSSAAVTRAAALGIVYDVVSGADVASMTVSFTATLNSATSEGTIAAATNSATTLLGSDDYATLTIGADSVTATSGASTASSTVGIASALASAWSTKYGSNSSFFTLNADTASGKIAISVNAGSGNRAHNSAVALSYTNGTVTATTAVLGWVIGATKASTDNKMLGESVILLFKDDTLGSTGVTFPTVVVANGTSSSTLTSTLDWATASTQVGGVGSALNIWPTEGRGLAIPSYDGVGSVVITTASTTDLTARL
ncbi:hypothetical protein N9P83_02330 [Flavobacteriaceae bacterium]|nr:hypothetical protein [Flavobacteriaceae bacterium]